MPIRVSWHNEEKTIVLLSFEPGEYTWEELHATYHEVWEMITAQPHTVHLFNDVRKEKYRPPGNVLGNYRRIDSGKPSNLGITYVIGVTSLGKLLSEVFTKAMRTQNKLRFVKDIEEAEGLVAEDAQTAANAEKQPGQEKAPP
jgi:hypothetical protein